MNGRELRGVWDDFTRRNDFMLNPDTKFVERIIEGLLANEKSSGLKLCPCRLSDGTKDGKISLLCPCNFRTHATWEKEGRCWCGLFVKRKG